MKNEFEWAQKVVTAAIESLSDKDLITSDWEELFGAYGLSASQKNYDKLMKKITVEALDSID